MNTYEAPVDLCPHCGYGTNRTSPLTSKSGPKPGDFTICLNCGEFLRFNDDLRMTKTTDFELTQNLDPKHIKTVRIAQQFIKDRGPIEKRNDPN